MQEYTLSFPDRQQEFRVRNKDDSAASMKVLELIASGNDGVPIRDAQVFCLPTSGVNESDLLRTALQGAYAAQSFLKSQKEGKEYKLSAAAIFYEPESLTVWFYLKPPITRLPANCSIRVNKETLMCEFVPQR